MKKKIVPESKIGNGRGTKITENEMEKKKKKDIRIWEVSQEGGFIPGQGVCVSSNEIDGYH